MPISNQINNFYKQLKQFIMSNNTTPIANSANYDLTNPTTYSIQEGGYYGTNQDFGGSFIPPMLIEPLQDLADAFEKYRNDSDFLKDLAYYQTNFVGRPSPLIYAKNLTEQLGGAKIYLKNEGANLTGAHKINHCLYQALLAKRMGKTEIICETGAGQHGIACATVCAKFGLKCTIYMGAVDVARQYPNVFFMKQLGANVISVETGNKGLSEAVDAAFGDFVSDPSKYFMVGSAVGPAPYPEIMREGQKVISKETITQIQQLEGKLPDYIVACIGGGCNAVGSFNEYLINLNVKLIGVEGGGKNLKIKGQHASRIASHQGEIAVEQGFKSMFLLDNDKKRSVTESLSAGLNYYGIGPIHAFLHSIGRITMSAQEDHKVIAAFQTLAKTEGLIGALESCHAVAEAIDLAPTLSKDKIIIVNLSGRADAYLFNVANALKDEDFKQFIKEQAKN
jgi:tryptophan synthase beta chain